MRKPSASVLASRVWLVLLVMAHVSWRQMKNIWTGVFIIANGVQISKAFLANVFHVELNVLSFQSHSVAKEDVASQPW
jgi:hypothetical protein